MVARRAGDVLRPALADPDLLDHEFTDELVRSAAGAADPRASWRVLDLAA